MNKKIAPIILVRSLKVERGGITKAAITRANALAEKFKNVKIVTFLYQQHHTQIIADLKERGFLDKRVKVLNFFEDIKPNRRKRKRSKRKDLHLIREKDLIEFLDSERNGGTAYRYYKEGLYVKYKRFNQDGSLEVIDYMDEDRHRNSREEYDRLGYLVRIRHMDKYQNKPRLDRYFDHKDNCYMSVWLNSKTGNEQRTLFFGRENLEYKELNEFQQVWLDDIIDSASSPVVMCEQRSLDHFLLNIKRKDVKKMSVVHANHLEEPFNDIADIKKSYTNLFKHVKQLDNIVLLTNEQKRDVESIYGFHDSLKVISHPSMQIEGKKTKRKTIDYNPKLAVTLARFHEDKQLNEAICAFKYVVEKLPTARYYIYGYGPLKKTLQKLIDELELQENVFLKRYTLESEKTYKEAACTILTSRQEGFGMVITESMAAGTPVISYDTKYGPKDIITDGINGYIIPKGDKELLAEKILSVLNNNSLRQELSMHALQIRETFSEDKYKEQWFNLIEEK